MTTFDDVDAIGRRAEALRSEFDASFAALPPTANVDLEDLLALTVGGEPHAIRVRQLAGLVPSRKIVALPSRTEGFLGVAGVRGSVVSVWSLERLLGSASQHATATWLALAEGAAPDLVAFAFADMGGFLRVPTSSIVPHGGGGADAGHVREIARVGEVVRPIIDIASVCERIKRQAGSVGTNGEG